MLDAGHDFRHRPCVTENPSQTNVWLFRLFTALWMATAIPITIFSFFLLELPLWPEFDAESTPEGIALWAATAAWFYVTPVALIIVARRWSGRGTS